MKFRTEINIPKSKLKINHRSPILMIGSCFASSIGQKLIDNKFNVNVNPFGVLYNPTSILNGIELLLENKAFTEKELFLDKGIYSSFSHHSSFSNSSRQGFLNNANASLQNAAEVLKTIDVLFITFGTAYAYRHKEKDIIVGNCHKLPSTNFDRVRLSITDIVKQWHGLIPKLKSLNPKLQIIFTVSPIRHLRDGAHDNQLSKSTLLLAIDKLCQINVDTHYFPSYEIILDDLRDYRFYNQDMTHPNNFAIDYIWNIFKDVYLAKESDTIIAEWNKIKQAIEHRATNQESDEHIQFLKQTLLKLNNFGAKYQYILLDSERKALEDKIK